MDRRRFLASVALCASLAGFPGAESPDPETPSGETSSPESSGSQSPERDLPATETAPPTARGSPTKRATTTTPPEASAVVRSAYRHRIHTDAFRVVAPERSQFAFVRPPTVVGETPPSAFELALGDRRFDPETTLRTPPWTPPLDRLYTDDEPSGWLPFDVSTVETDRAALVADGRRYPLPDETLSDLASLPEFVVESVSVPDRVEVGDPIQLTVEVRNEGDREGVFLAGFQYSGLPDLITTRIAPGETKTTIASYEAFQVPRMRIVFRYARGWDEYEVVIEGADTHADTDTA